MLPIWAAVRLPSARAGDIVKELWHRHGRCGRNCGCRGRSIRCARSLSNRRTRASAALRHITEVIENQGGPPWTYLWEMPRFFGELVWIPLGAAIMLVIKAPRHARTSRADPVGGDSVRPVFDLRDQDAGLRHGRCAGDISSCRRISGCGCGSGENSQRSRAAGARSSRRVSVVLALLPARYLLGPTGPLERRDRNPMWTHQLRALNQQIGARRAVIFNVPSHIETMFYTPYGAYDLPATKAQAENCAAGVTTCIVFTDGVATPLPANAE